jgi:tetratricopeptide (TPR) repeat protein
MGIALGGFLFVIPAFVFAQADSAERDDGARLVELLSSLLDPAEVDVPDSLDLDGRNIPVAKGAARGYVPDSACRSCHATVGRTYDHVGMAKSFYRPRPDNVIEDFQQNRFFHAASNFHYEMIQRDGEFFQKQYQVAADGRPIHELEQRIDFVIGSGSHVRTYLYRTPGGELFQLPVCWYTQAQSWGMSPGYDRASHSGVTRRVDRECMFCHNAYPDVPAKSDLLEEPPWFPNDLPEGIGCQRCHGPGAEHVRIATIIGSGIPAIRGSIVNPSNLSPRLRDDVCLQCHLQPQLFPPSYIRVFGRGDYSYRPGQPLTDYLLHVDHDQPEGVPERFEINHHPYRLYQSKCYQRSEGRMSCLTCHDPHAKVPAESAAEHYRSRCLTCHDVHDCPNCRPSGVHGPPDEGVASQNCVRCHMPPRRAQDVVHTVMTDHRIQRGPPRDSWTAPLREREPETGPPPKPYWADRQSPMLDLHLDILATMFGDGSRLGAIESTLGRIQPDSADPFLHLAQLQCNARQFREAADVYARLADRFPTRSSVYRGWGYALAMQGEYASAVGKLRRAVQAAPLNAHYHFLLGSTLVADGRRSEGIAELEEAVRLRPHYADARVDLGTAYTAAGKYQEAAMHLRHALAVQPADTEAYVRLGEVLLELGEPADAVRFLRHAQPLNQNDAEMKITYACALACKGEYAEALTEVATADRLGADKATCLAATAVARHGQGEVGEAQRDLAAARSAASERAAPSLLRGFMIERASSAASRSLPQPQR